MDLTKAAKLTVGDIADYEAWRRERRKCELVEITKELYPDNVPKDALVQIEDELRKIPSLMDDAENAFDLVAAQYLFWKALSKNDPDITMKQVGDFLEVEKIEKYSAALFPVGLTDSKKKKRKKSKAAIRKARKKKKK